jgi:hypothetical protein
MVFAICKIPAMYASILPLPASLSVEELREDASMNPAVDKNASLQKRLELVYCPMCTHMVQGYVAPRGKRLVVGAGQICSRCHSALDAGYVIRRNQAA